MVKALGPLLLALAILPSTVFAHQLDEYLQATLVDFEPGDIRLKINLTPGVAVAEQILGIIDRDRDGVISSSEAAAYADMLKHDLTVRLDQRNIDLKLTAINIPAPADLRGGWEIIRLEFSFTPGSLADGKHSLTLENRHLPAISAYLLNAELPKFGSVQIAAQIRNQNQSTGEIEFNIHSPATSSSGGR